MAALKEAARQGRGGDTRLGHLTNGDVVIPAERLNEKTRKLVDLFLRVSGVKDPKRFTVGHGQNARNPKTRLPEFSDSGASSGGTDAPGSDSPGNSGPADSQGAAAQGAAAAAGSSDPGNTGAVDSQGATAAGLAGAPAAAGAPPGPGGEIGTGHDLGTGANHGIGFGGSTEGQMANMPGLPGFVGNQLSNLGLNVGIDNELTGFNPTGVSFDPAALAALGINLGIGMVPGLGIANLAAGLFGHDIGHTVVGGVQGMSSSPSSGSPTGAAGFGADVGGGAGFDSLGGNIGTGFDDSILKRRLREA